MNKGNFLLLSVGFFAMGGYAETEKTPEDPNLETIVVTASRQASRLMDAPASVSVVKAEELNRIDADDLADALTTQAGVIVTSVGRAAAASAFAVCPSNTPCT